HGVPAAVAWAPLWTTASPKPVYGWRPRWARIDESRENVFAGGDTGRAGACNRADDVAVTARVTSRATAAATTHRVVRLPVEWLMRSSSSLAAGRPRISGSLAATRDGPWSRAAVRPFELPHIAPTLVGGEMCLEAPDP